MIHRLRERMTYGNVVATLALFVALGGTSYAAITLPRNSVGAAQLRTSSVRSAEVKDRSLGARDLSLGARRFLKGQRGETGPRGPQGPRGDPGGTIGTPGSPALALTYVAQQGTAPPGAVGEEGGSGVAAATADCPAGRRVTGGGVRVDVGDDASAGESYPNLNNTAWTGVVGNDDEQNPATFTVFAICTPTP
jgi:hypothetical protein